MVTGKNKEQFVEFLRESESMVNKVFYHIAFKDLPFEMQIGVFLAYYDSLDFHLSLDFINSKCYEVQLVNSQLDSVIYYSAKTRNEAYKKAFKQADKLINNK